jgi:hypothetical protein
VDRPDRAMRRRPVLVRRLVPVEEQEDAVGEPMPGTALAERLEAEHLAVETPRLLFVLGRAVDDRLKDTGQLHGLMFSAQGSWVTIT